MKVAELTEGQVIELEITEEDVEAGIPSNCSRCPTALALLRLFEMGTERFEHMSVGHYAAEVEDLHQTPRWATLEFETRLTVQITKFDRGEGMETGTYELTVQAVEELPEGEG